MGEYKKLSVTIGAYYEIRDAEMYGGKGSTGYTSSVIEGDGEMIHNDFDSYVYDQRVGLSEWLGVPIESIRVITKEEYEEATGEE